jgi:hypothetical protein
LHLSSPVIGSVGSYERLPDGFFESRQTRRDMCAEMDAQNSPIALCSVVLGSKTWRLDTSDRRFGWHERLLAVFGRMDMQSTGAGRSTLSANPSMRRQFQSRINEAPVAAQNLVTCRE